jgi:hypothetical protein
VGFAVVGNSDTFFVSIENPSFGAGKAFLVVPVPGSASGVSRLGVVGVREQALSVLEVVSFEAGSTVTILSVGLTLIRNGDTNLVGVEDPSARAGEADLIVPVPGSAARVRGLGIVGFREDTTSFLQVITLEA